MMKSSFMDFEFGKVHYQELQSGKETTLLLLHAFHSSAASYAQLCELLKDHFNLICLDLPGHGLSEHVDCEKHAWYYSMDGFTAVVTEFIKNMALENFVIIGDSVGGNCAVRAMGSLKELKGLVLMGSAQAANVKDLFSLHHQSEALNVLFQENLSSEQCELLAAAYVNSDKNEGKNFELMMSDVKNTDPNCRKYFSYYMEHQEWVDELQLVQNATVPLMYILGEKDGFIDSGYYKRTLLQSGLKDAQVHILADVRHVPQLDNPPVCAQEILAFLIER